MIDARIKQLEERGEAAAGPEAEARAEEPQAEAQTPQEEASAEETAAGGETATPETEEE